MKHSNWIAALAVLSAPFTVQAAEQALLCFGNEPFWQLDLTQRGMARFSTPDSAAVAYRGGETRLDHRKESVWRSRSQMRRGGDLVAFLREGQCSDGMSDTVHPVSVNVSLPDGRHLAGCCRVPAASATIEGATWRLTALPGTTLPSGSARNAVTARFEGGRVSGFSGCNQFSGSYTVDRDKLAVGPLAGTMMACPEPAMGLERAFHKAFNGHMTMTVDGEGMTLTPANGEPLRFVREAAVGLEGTKWEVTGYNNGRQAVVGPKLGTQLNIAFKGGKVYGFAGCNRFHGPFKLEGNALSIGPLGSSRKMCAEDVMAQEREFLAALETARKWDIVRGMLDVHRADGERVLTANEVK